MFYYSKKLMVLTGLVGCMSLAHATVQPDNSAVNQRDDSKYSKTADYQASTNRKSDVDVTRKIRHELIKDSSLSTNGQNVKIVTEDGMVTLRGPVNTAKERRLIGDLARKIVGKNQVHNELEVKL